MPPAGLNCGGWKRSAIIGLQIVVVQQRHPLQAKHGEDKLLQEVQLLRARKKKNILIAEVDANKDMLFGSIKTGTKGACHVWDCG